MKLTVKSIDHKAEGMKPKNRQPGIYPPPDDGREWILIDEAAALYGIKPASMAAKMRKLNFTRTCRRGVKAWLLKKDVTDYLAFLKDREQYRKRRCPKHWEPLIDMNAGEDEWCERIFWTADQAAAFMNVSKQTLSRWVKQGKIPAFVTRKSGQGGKYWYSPTSLRNLKADEQYQKGRAAYAKGKETLQQGIHSQDAYVARHKPRRYPNVPKGWLSIREVAERLQITNRVVRRLRARGRFHAMQFPDAYDQKRYPWFIHEDSVEQLKNEEYYQTTRRRGKQAVEAAIGRQIYTDPADTPNGETLPHQPFRTNDGEELTFGYTRDELRLPRERTIPPDEMW